MNKKQPSIILVTVDCLRADHVGFMGYERRTTPFLDSLACESVVVPNAIVAGAPTYYSLPAMMASRYPLALGRDVLGIAPDEPTLASILSECGYATAAFSAANPYISSRFGYQHGFDVFRDYLNDESAVASPQPKATSAGWSSRINREIQRMRPALGPLGRAYDELYFRYCQRVTPVPSSIDELRRFPAADVIVDHACNWLDSLGERPFFLWLHLMDPHSPYYPKQEALQLMNFPDVDPRRARYLNSFWNRGDLGESDLKAAREDVVWLYDAGIRWVDEQIARLQKHLQSSGRWDNNIFALTADHGEEFLDHGGRYHPPVGLKEELIHVPLLLRIPGAASQGLSDEPFSLIHLAPTLLDSAEVPIPDNFNGNSLCSRDESGRENESRVSISECVAGCTNPFLARDRIGSRVLAIRDSRFKLIIDFKQNLVQLFDLQKDPGETAPLGEDVQRSVRRRLLSIARDHIAESSQRDPKQRLQARLRELLLEWDHPAQASLPVAS